LYSDWELSCCAEIIERVTGRTLDDDLAKARYFFAPGEQHEYRPPQHWGPQIGTEPTTIYGTGWCRAKFTIKRVCKRRSSAAGVLSTAQDLAAFARLLLDRRRYAHQRMCDVGTMRNHDAAASLGGSGRWAGRCRRGRSSGHYFSGAQTLGIPDSRHSISDHPTGSFCVLLTNRVHPRGKYEDSQYASS